jgi:hypothetical protein
MIKMDRGLWIAKKNRLCGLIKKLSDILGGDEVEWLREYCREVVAEYPDDRIDEAIFCFMDLLDQLRWVPHRTKGKEKNA